MNKCAKCGKPTGATIEKLWNGPNGYRIYKVCDKCARTINDERTKKEQIVTPGTPANTDNLWSKPWKTPRQ
jgi:protein-arginine kinase activator protein McsA